MSQTKKLKSLLLAIFALFAFFVYGCGDTKVEVDNISVNLESQSQIVLLVDDFFDLTGKVEISPSYATDKTFSIYSLNENVARIVGNKIVAEGVGETFIRVVSNSNENLEDVISVSVVAESITLDSPYGLEYDESLQTFKFNPVDNAASYTININGLETNLGNITSFKLSDYVGKKYNEVLSVKVRANASTFGKAYVNSEYSGIIKIYQTEKVENVSIFGGKLNLPVNPVLVYDVYFDNIKMFSQLTSGEVDLNALSEELAGTTKKVKIEARPSETIKQQINQAGVTYVSSASDEIVLNILAEPEIEIKGDVIFWNAIPFVDSYTVFIGSNQIVVENNYLDLKTLPNYAKLGVTETFVKVKSNLSSTSKNLAKTVKQSNEISFIRLNAPSISVLENGFKWSAVDNASAYFVEVKNGNNVIFSASTNATTFDLSNYGAGTYNIEVNAIGNNEGGNYLSSSVASATITKHGEISAAISDYVLNITTVVNERYLITIDDIQFGNVIIAQGTNSPVDLSSENFTAGLHNIKIKRLGNGINSVNGIETVVSFTQLEEANVVINNSVASVNKSTINQNAIISLEIKGGTLVQPIVKNVESYEFNTTVSGSDFLAAGNYDIVAYVNGDGSSTFAYRGTAGGKNPVACEITNFTVLAAPQIAIGENGISWRAENAKKYNIQVENVNESKFEVNSENVNKTSVDMVSYKAGKYYVKVRANGHNDGGNYVSSQISSVEIVKHDQVEAVIKDYELKISTIENEKYLVNFIINDNNTYTETLTASSNEMKIDLSVYNFKAGVHNISITRLGNADNKTINGIVKVVSFTQLEAANVVISNSIANVNKSETNKHATIKLQISGETLANVIDIDGATYVFNTTDTSAENFLEAGEYRIVAFIVGDGSSTFSYRGTAGGIDAIACEKTEFTVLAIPGLEVLDKSMAEIYVKTVANAENYSILDENEQVIESVADKYSFDLASGETKKFKVRANGNGSTTLCSMSSDVIVVSRLTTPTITFYPSVDTSLNVQENSFKFDANNNMNYYDLINFYHNNTLINGYSAGSTFTSFVEGENKFKVDLISKGMVDGVYYINSFTHEIEVNKYYTASKIYTDTSNNIVVENPNSEKLFIDLTINGVKYIDNGSNQIVNGSVVLDYTYSNNKHYINIFNNKNIKIAGVNQGDNLIVQAQFRRTSASNNIDSDISSKFSVNYLIAPKFERDNQNIYFTSSYEGYDLSKYNLIINGTKVVTMESIADKFASEEVGTLTKYTIAIADLWNALKNNGLNTLEVNSLAIQILNSATNEDNPILYAYGEEIYVQQAQTFEIKTEKIDGLTYVKVQTVQTDYEKSYVINVLGENEYTINDGSIISIPLDDKNFEGELNIFGYVKANASYNNGKDVFVFNSNMSATLSVLRLLTPELFVNNNTIYYTDISNATDYEVYVKEGGYVKVDETRLERIANGFRFKELGETAEITIKVKAITTNSQIVNSNLSEAIIIKKIGKASASVINGQVGIKLPAGWQELVQNGVETKLDLDFAGRKYECTITYNTEANTYLTSIEGITWSQSNDAFMMNSALIFNYGDPYIIEKPLKIRIKLNGAYNGKHYLYSDVYETAVKRLFAPTNVKVEKLNDYAERISWENNSKNSLTNGGEKLYIDQYVFEFIYDKDPYNEENEVLTYYSTDSRLKYKTSTGFAPYEISSTNASFPYGYDANNDGDFDDEGDVVFGEGGYNIRVAAYKGDYVTSPYSAMCPFKVLSTTKVSIEDGKLKWDTVVNATNYVVRIKDLTGSVVKAKEITRGLMYDFEDFSSGNEFYNVTVQAITTKSYMLNSKESEPLLFYRLPVASEIKIDDGLLKVTASPLAYAIDVIYGGNTYRFVNASQEEKLNTVIQNGMMNAFLSGKTEIEDIKRYIMTAIKDTRDVVHIMDLSSDYPELNGVSCNEIKIRICGNTGVVSGFESIQVGMVNSQTTTKNITAQVLSTNINEVKAGVWQFSQNSELGTTSKAQLNYNFNNVTNVHSFWLDTIVYKIEIAEQRNGETTNHIIYAVDYNRFDDAVEGGVLTQDNTQKTYYELCDDKLGLYARVIYVCEDSSKLYFNVYLDGIYDSDGILRQVGNIINLQDHNVLYYSPNFYEEGKNNNSLNYVDLAAGGTYVVNIRTLGGDELIDKAYLNSPNVEQTFIRYGINRVSTYNGRVVVDDFKMDGKASPIYKIGVKLLNAGDGVDWTYVYLFDAKNATEEDDVEKLAEEVRSFLKLPADAKCEPMIFVNKDGKKYIAFEMSKYFDPDTYEVQVQTLAGVGADDYLLNAKIPDEENAISVFNAPDVRIEKGNFVFNASRVNRDGNLTYADKYEISITFDGNEYTQQFSVNDLDCKKEGNTITYILPSSIGDLAITNNGSYEFKIKAITTTESLVNSKFTEIKTFTRETSVSDVKIEDGKLKWTSSETGNYLIKITNPNNNETIIITSGYTRDGSVYTYEFKEQEYEIWGENTSVQIYPNINYIISVSRIGNDGENGNVISSSYVDVENVSRIMDVGSTSIVANLGILTWTKIEGATGYILEMVGTSGTSGNYKYTISTNINSIDLASVTYDGSENLLPAGKYKAKIRVLGGSQINSLLTTSEKEFIKLNSVLDSDVEFKVNETTKDTEIVWTTITGTNKYIVRFEYMNVLGESVDITHNDVEGDRIVAPTDVVGKLKTTIIAYGRDSSNLLNSDALIVETKTDAPKSIKELTYNEELNRFEWEVDNSDFTNSDKLIVRYDFTEFALNGQLGVVAKEFEINYKESGRYDSELDLYYFNLSVMGKYKNFTVTVHRTNNLDTISNKIDWELRLFTCGDGTSEKPYIIENQEMLNNMRYYPNAYYHINNNISIDNTKTYASAILDFEFAGHIDGAKSQTENYQIDLGNITLKDVQEFALFKSLNGATITNLDISGNVENVITNQITGDVKIALLAVDSTNSTLTNVRIVTSTITIKEGVENTTYEIIGNLYVSGFFALDTGSALTNCYIVGDYANEITGLIINLDVDVSIDEYIGGISAYANITNVTGGKFNIEITNQESQIKYVGGLFAYFTGDNSNNKGCVIQNVEVDIIVKNVKVLYLGGIVGYAQYVTIQNNTVAGQIIYSGLNNTTLYFGGVAGGVSDCLIYGNTVYSENIKITITSTVNSDFYLGLIVGSISQNKLNCELKGNYAEIEKQTLITTGVLTLGVYGAATEGVDVDISYTE